MRRSPRYRIQDLGENECAVHHAVDEYGDTIEEPRVEIYWAPLGGGYIRETTHKPGTTGSQVCDGMASCGPTLMWWPEHRLSETIRRETRAFYRAVDVEAACERGF